jgi:hypothetical protein
VVGSAKQAAAILEDFNLALEEEHNGSSGLTDVQRLIVLI